MGEDQRKLIERWAPKRRAAFIVRVFNGETAGEVARQHGLSDRGSGN